MIEKYKNTLEVFKEAMATTYSLENHNTDLFDEKDYDYDIKCGSLDEEKILKK